MNKSAEKATTYTLTIIDRILMFSATIITILIFPFFVFKFTHYSFMPLPIFSSPTLSNTPYTEPSYIWNFCVYFSFFIQHGIMITIFFKTSIPKMIPKYPLYERYIFNFVSTTYYIFILDIAKPIYNEQQILFRIPFILSVILAVLGNLIFAGCMLQIGGILFVPFKISDILSSKTITFEGYRSVTNQPLIQTGVYKIVRHPLQFSLILLCVFNSNEYTIDRLIFIAAHIFGIVIGINMEEKKLLVKHPDTYRAYQKKMTSRLIPFIY